MVTFLRQRIIWSFHVVIAQAQPLYYSLNRLFGCVPVPLPRNFVKQSLVNELVVPRFISTSSSRHYKLLLSILGKNSAQLVIHPIIFGASGEKWCRSERKPPQSGCLTLRLKLSDTKKLVVVYCTTVLHFEMQPLCDHCIIL